MGERKYEIAEKSCINYYEFLLQMLVNFIVRSRVEIGVKSRFSCSFPLTSEELVCHLWLLRLSFVAFDLVISGI